MPSSKTTLDLDAWTNILPKQRSNDYEFNLLLYKFKSFFNEVRDFKELHSNCSVSRATLASGADPPIFGSSTISESIGLPSQNITTSSTSKYLVPNLTTSSDGQQMISVSLSNNSNKKLFQHQNSVPISSKDSRDFTIKNYLHYEHPAATSSSSQQKKNGTCSTSAPHHNSNYNLANSKVSSNITHSIVNRPEIRQRNQVSNSRFLISRSSERLDTINNNHMPLTSSYKSNDLETFQGSSLNNHSAADSDGCIQDDNIYDAVSPDDIPNEEVPSYNVTSSIHNLNRLSLSQKGKLESSKSSLGLGFSADTSKTSSNTSKEVSRSSNKSVPFENNDQEKSYNSYGSSIIIDNTNHSSSSLSLLANKDQNDYANYVNIDFFLKRSNSPSFDGLEEDAINEDEDSSDDSDEDTTNMSRSLSSDQLCDEVLRGISSRELANKLSHKDTENNSSSSITPASSGDFLNDHRSSSLIQQSASSNKRSDMSNKLSSFFSTSNRENDSPTINLISPREVNKTSPPHQALSSIRETTSGLITLKQATNLEPNQVVEESSQLAEASNSMRSFLSDLNLSSGDDAFEDKAQRRIVKESFAVEFCGRRKLRHLFLFNDVIVCAKYQASSKQKFTFDVKWYLNLNGVSILDLSDVSNLVKYDKEAIENQILAIRTSLMLLRGQMQHIKRSKHKQPSKIIKKLKKKRTELEAELVLLLPHLPLVIKHVSGKKYTFFLSSNFDRSQWVESIKFLQSQLPLSKGSSTSPSSSELQAWIQTCRKNLNPSLGTFLLRSNCDDDLLYGDLCVNLCGISGVTKPGQYYFCFEVDSYGHFSQKASSAVMRIDDSDRKLNEEYMFPLDGAHTLRILLYEDLGSTAKPSIIGKAHIELSRAWFSEKPVEKSIVFNSNCSLTTKLSYSNSELLSMRVPHAKPCPTFGMDITQVCKKEKTNVPLLIQLCVNEVERRGMREVGIYRMSGTSTDIQRLKKAFETNPYVAELLLKDIDINSVTGFLKTYLREMPEGLFSNKLYPKFVVAFNIPPTKSLERTKTMIELFHKIPITNQHTIIYLVEHLVKVFKYENYNKMSLTNLATVLGPNISRPPAESSGSNTSDPFTTVVIDSMSQAGILYFFLNRKFSNLPLTELDPSELARPPGN